MASVRAATFMSASARATVASETVTLRVTGCIPSSVNVTTYTPGGRPAKLYAPPSPEMVSRVPCRFAEETETVTPGTPAPSSVTVPVRDAVVCAPAALPR
jgi:hypothetical protein